MATHDHSLLPGLIRSSTCPHSAEGRHDGALRLGWLHALRHKWQTLIVSLCVAATVGLPVAAEWLLTHYEREFSVRARRCRWLRARKAADSTRPSVLYYRVIPIEPATMALAHEIAEDKAVVAVPMHARFTARGYPVVAIGADYFDIRGSGPVRAASDAGRRGSGGAVAEKLGSERAIRSSVTSGICTTCRCRRL